VGIRFVTRSDVHISDHTPQSRTDNWIETVAEKLAQVGEIAREVGAHAVLDNGDFFDVKSPARNSHALVRLVADVHAKYPCPVWGNVGNHDCVYGNLGYLDQQPLGVLFSTGVFKRCYGEYARSLFDPDSRVKVRVVGIPYHGPKYDMEWFKVAKTEKEDYLVVLAHVLASSRGGTMFEGEDIVKYDDALNLSPEVDCWVFGHWHKDQGIVEHRPGKWIVNIGALTRGSLSQDDLDREPGVAILTFTKDGIGVERRNLAVRPVDDVFNLERRVQAETRAMTMEAFVSSLRETLGKEVNSESLQERIDRMGVPDNVRERAILYIEEAESSG